MITLRGDCVINQQAPAAALAPPTWQMWKNRDMVEFKCTFAESQRWKRLSQTPWVWLIQSFIMRNERGQECVASIHYTNRIWVAMCDCWRCLEAVYWYDLSNGGVYIAVSVIRTGFWGITLLFIQAFFDQLQKFPLKSAEIKMIVFKMEQNWTHFALRPVLVRKLNEIYCSFSCSLVPIPSWWMGLLDLT